MQNNEWRVQKIKNKKNKWMTTIEWENMDERWNKKGHIIRNLLYVLLIEE